MINSELQNKFKLNKDEILLLKRLVYYERVRVHDEIINEKTNISREHELLSINVKLSNKSVYGDLLNEVDLK